MLAAQHKIFLEVSTVEYEGIQLWIDRESNLPILMQCYVSVYKCMFVIYTIALALKDVLHSQHQSANKGEDVDFTTDFSMPLLL